MTFILVQHDPPPPPLPNSVYEPIIAVESQTSSCDNVASVHDSDDGGMVCGRGGGGGGGEALWAGCSSVVGN